MPEQFRFSAAAVTSTTAVDIFPANTAATAVVRSLTLCNPSTSATASVDVTMYVAAQTASFYLHRVTQVTASQTVMPLTAPLVVSAGNALRLARTGNDIDAAISFLELS